MNTIAYFKNSTKALAAFMFATVLVTGFTACSEDYRLEDFLSQQFLDAGIIDWINSKAYSTDEIQQMLVEQVENGLTANGRTYTPEQMAEMFDVKTISTSFSTSKEAWGKAEKLFTAQSNAYFANADNFKSVPAQSTDACTVPWLRTPLPQAGNPSIALLSSIQRLTW